MSTFPRIGNFDLQNGADSADDFAPAGVGAIAGDIDVSGQYASVADPETDEPDELLQDIARSSTLSVFGPSLEFKGALVADEDLLIQGQIHGTIEHNADNLTIGVHGKVNADVRARSVLVQGEVTGDIVATERVIVAASARVTGDLYAPKIGLKEGARFKGRIDMDGKPPARKTVPAPEAVSASSPPPSASASVTSIPASPASPPAASSASPPAASSATLPAAASAGSPAAASASSPAASSSSTPKSRRRASAKPAASRDGMSESGVDATLSGEEGGESAN